MSNNPSWHIKREEGNHYDSKFKSLTESFANIIPAFGIGFLSNKLILPYFGEGIINNDNITLIIITVIFSVISLVRTYSIRRLFLKISWKDKWR